MLLLIRFEIIAEEDINVLDIACHWLWRVFCYRASFMVIWLTPNVFCVYVMLLLMSAHIVHGKSQRSDGLSRPLHGLLGLNQHLL